MWQEVYDRLQKPVTSHQAIASARPSRDVEVQNEGARYRHDPPDHNGKDRDDRRNEALMRVAALRLAGRKRHAVCSKKKKKW